MNAVAIAISCCLLAQAASDTDPHRAKVVPRKAPAVRLDDDPAPPTAPPSKSRYSREPSQGEPAGGADNQLRVPAERPAAALEPESHEPSGQGGHQKSRPPDLLAEALATPKKRRSSASRWTWSRRSHIPPTASSS